MDDDPPSVSLSNPFSESVVGTDCEKVYSKDRMQSPELSDNLASMTLDEPIKGVSKTTHNTPDMDQQRAHVRTGSLKLEKKDEYQILLDQGYTYHEKLGEGAFSIVLRGNNSKTGEDLAIKILSKKKLDEAQQKLVFKEVSILRRLDHPNIVSFDSFFEDDNHYYINQELCAGGEIFNQIVNLTYFSEDLARHVICQVAEAVKYLHNEIGVVHRDLKPENLLFEPIDHAPSKKILLRRSDDPNTKKDEGVFKYGIGGGCIGMVKLADFGLSKQIWETKTKTPCGTVGYTAPEIVKDERYSKKVDMWALGCVLYTLLCGFPPFYDENIDDLTEKISKGQFEFLRPWWDEISAGAKNCVLKLLCVSSAQRYDINEFFEDPWIKSFLKKVPKDLNGKYIYSGYDEKKEREKVKPKRVYYYPNMYSPALASPAAMVLKDAFDVSTAVHRQNEERALRDQLMANTFEIVQEEDDEDEPLNPFGGNKGIFNLDLDKSSIIQRRKNEVAA